MTSPNLRPLWPSLLVYGGVMLLFLVFGFFETSRQYSDANYQLTTIVITHPQVVKIFQWFVFAVAITLLIGSAVSLKFNVLRWPMIGVLIALLFYPFCGLVHAVINLAPWYAFESVVAKDNTRYTLLDSTFLQGQMMAIGQVTHQNRFTTTYRVLVHNNGDSPRSWASVIRPDNASNTYGQMYLTDQQILTGIRYGNSCYLAYDLKTKTPYGHGDIESLSPAASLNDNDQPNETDIQNTCKYIESHLAYCLSSGDIRFAQNILKGEAAPGCPSLSTLRADALSDRPTVAAIAKRLMACYEPGLAKLQALVDQESIETK